MNYYPPELVDWWMDDWISLGRTLFCCVQKYYTCISAILLLHWLLYRMQQLNISFFLFLVLLLLVYGKERTFKAKSVPVMHHTGTNMLVLHLC